MALTRGDKMIIIGAVALAATVVLGLAILKKPYLFTGSKPQSASVAPAPTSTPAQVEQPSSMPMLPASPPPKAESALPVSPPAPTTPRPEVQAIPPAPSTAPMPAETTPVDRKDAAPIPAPPAAQAPKATTTPSSGDETLEKMFAEIAGTPPSASQAKDKAGAGPKAETPASVTEHDLQPAKAPGEPAVAEPAEPAEPAPAAPTPTGSQVKENHQAKAEAAKTAAPKAATETAKAAAKKAKPHESPEPKPVQASAEPKPTASGGSVARIVAEEKPGEYVLTIQTNKAPGTMSKTFLMDPPRLVVDLAGPWAYNGALSRDTGNDFIRRIRVGKHKDMFRVVLDMSPDATARLRGAPTLDRVPEGVALRIPK